MKYLLILSIFLIISISMCVDLPFDLPVDLPFGDATTSEKPGEFIIDQGSPDLYLRVQTIPLVVKTGRMLTLVSEIRNKNNFKLTNIDVEAYDRCIFSGDSYSHSPDGNSLSPNETDLWRWEWTAGETDLEKTCEIKIMAQYDGLYSLSQDIVVLSDGEYRIKEVEGTLNSVPIQQHSSNNPFSITLTFPESQPLRSNTPEYTMYIDYYTTGVGFVEVNDGNITIEVPGNIDSMECEDYISVPGGLELNKDLRFINNKAVRTVCNFKTDIADGPLDIKSLYITVNYRYTLDNSVSVKVTP
jgi:hypothetical protein